MNADEQGIVRQPHVPGRKFFAVDLDGTLAHYDKWVSTDHIGEPVPLMVENVKRWMDAGHVICIFTSRVAGDGDKPETYARIHAWCEKHLGRRLYVTATKERYFESIYDDRAHRVIQNTGQIVA